MGIGNNTVIQSVRQGPAGRVTLSEPASHNALSPAMVSALFDQLILWREDPCVKWVVIEGAGEKAFSAGADVKAMWRHAMAGEYGAIRNYFAQEYALHLLIAEHPTPCIALVDGICFGGGMALAVNARYSVASETASFCMPETLIGFFPDAGATWFLSRLPRALGIYLGLTGARLTGADAVRLGLVSHFVPHKEFGPVVAEVISRGTARLATIDFPLPASSLAPYEDQIQKCFDVESLDDIFRAPGRGHEYLGEANEADIGSPFAGVLKWTLQSLREPGENLQECLQNELKLVEVSTRHPDFREGVRAALIDKDKSPRWQVLESAM